MREILGSDVAGQNSEAHPVVCCGLGLETTTRFYAASCTKSVSEQLFWLKECEDCGSGGREATMRLRYTVRGTEGMNS